MKPEDQRTTILIIIGITLAAMLLLAASLSSIKLAPGEQIPLNQLLPKFAPENGTIGDTSLIEKIIQYIFTALWALIPFYIIYLILSPAARKQFLKDLARILPFMIILGLLLNSLQTQQNQKQQEDLPKAGQAAQAPPISPDLSGDLKFSNQTPEWVITATSVVLAVSVTALLVAGGIFIYRQRRLKELEAEPLKKMAHQAQNAIDSIQAGGDLRDVVIRCYLEMTKIVADSRNLRRGEAMTPHEFEAFLQNRGLPTEPIHQLTMLFELVRYGGQNPGMQDEHTAIASLTAIVNACRRAA